MEIYFFVQEIEGDDVDPDELSYEVKGNNNYIQYLSLFLFISFIASYDVLF